MCPAQGRNHRAGKAGEAARSRSGRLHGFTDPETIRVECPPGLSDIDFAELRDLAAIEAFENALWINAYIRLSNTMRRNLSDCIREYRMLIDFFFSKTLTP